MPLHHLVFIFSLICIINIATSLNDFEYGSCTIHETFINGKCRCLPPYIQVNGECQESCPESSYPDWMTYTCQPCHSSCLDCWGPEHYQCLSCHPPEKTPFFVYDAVSQKCRTAEDCPINGSTNRGFCLFGSPSCKDLETYEDTIYLDKDQETCSSACYNDVLGLTGSDVSICGDSKCDESCGMDLYTGKTQCLGEDNSWTCLACDMAATDQILVSETSLGVPLYRCASPLPLNTIYIVEKFSYFYCAPQCWMCDGAPDNCTVCSMEGSVLMPDGTCRLECPTGMTSVTLESGQVGCMLDLELDSWNELNINIKGLDKFDSDASSLVITTTQESDVSSESNSIVTNIEEDSISVKIIVTYPRKH